MVLHDHPTATPTSSAARCRLQGRRRVDARRDLISPQSRTLHRRTPRRLLSIIALSANSGSDSSVNRVASSSLVERVRLAQSPPARIIAAEPVRACSCPSASASSLSSSWPSALSKAAVARRIPGRRRSSRVNRLGQVARRGSSQASRHRRRRRHYADSGRHSPPQLAVRCRCVDRPARAGVAPDAASASASIASSALGECAARRVRCRRPTSASRQAQARRRGALEVARGGAARRLALVAVAAAGAPAGGAEATSADERGRGPAPRMRMHKRARSPYLAAPRLSQDAMPRARAWQASRPAPTPRARSRPRARSCARHPARGRIATPAARRTASPLSAAAGRGGSLARPSALDLASRRSARDLAASPRKPHTASSGSAASTNARKGAGHVRGSGRTWRRSVATAAGCYCCCRRRGCCAAHAAGARATSMRLEAAMARSRPGRTAALCRWRRAGARSRRRAVSVSGSCLTLSPGGLLALGPRRHEPCPRSRRSRNGTIGGSDLSSRRKLARRTPERAAVGRGAEQAAGAARGAPAHARSGMARIG